MFKDSNFSHFPRQIFNQEKWEALRDLAEEKNIVIKNSDKGSCLVIWDSEDYFQKVDRQLSDTKFYKDVKYTKNMLSSLVDKSNKIFQSLSKKKYISEKGLNTLLITLPGRPVISDC